MDEHHAAVAGNIQDHRPGRKVNEVGQRHDLGIGARIQGDADDPRLHVKARSQHVIGDAQIGKDQLPQENENKEDHLPDLHEVIRGCQSAADDEQRAIAQDKTDQEIRRVEISRERAPGQGKGYVQEEVAHGVPPITAWM